VKLLDYFVGDGEESRRHAFVMSSGSDTNPCTITSPCRTLQAAFNVTPSSGGVIEAIDAAGYGGVTINHAIGVIGHGVALIGGQTFENNAIVINAGANDDVYLSGLIVDGGVGGNVGILLNSGASLTIEGSSIRNFGTGIYFTPTIASAAFNWSNLLVNNTLISSCEFYGIHFAPNGSANSTAVINKTEVILPQGIAVLASVNAGAANVTISDSRIMGSGYNPVNTINGNCNGGCTGVYATTPPSPPQNSSGVFTLNVRIQDTTITGEQIGILVTGGSTLVFVHNVASVYNVYGYQQIGGSYLVGDGTNNFANDAIGNTGSYSAITLQ
jgi:hypothetical protein